MIATATAVRKVGRPKTDNPRNVRVAIRVTNDELEELRDYAQMHSMTATQVILTGLRKMYAEKK